MSPLANKKHSHGFTMIEIMIASIIVGFVAFGVWGVYWSIINTYSLEQKGVNLQVEGERILDLMANGGNFKGHRIYGLNAIYPEPGYPRVGGKDDTSSDNFNIGFFDPEDDDYRIEFCIDGPGTYRRFIQFAVEFFLYDPGPPPLHRPTAKLYYRLRTTGTPDPAGNDDHNYEVLLTENLLAKDNDSVFGDSEATWGKVQLLPGAGNYYAGIKVSFYLADMTRPVQYNDNLERELVTPVADAAQRKRLLSGVPYPNYFSTTVYFPNRE